MSANLRAFLFLLRWCEGTSDENGYRALYGHHKDRPRLFDSFDDHPRKSFSTPWGRTSAAGAFQFLVGTWDDARKALDLPDFSPESQDKAAVWLIQRRGALHSVEQGDLDNAIHLCRHEWASLPGSPYGQPTRSMEECRAIFERAGGTLQTSVTQPDRKSVEAVGTPQPDSAAPTIGERIMAAPALIVAAAQALLPFIADLMRERGSKTSTRNADILERAPELVPVVMELGRAVVPEAKNEQEIVETIAASKELQTQLRAQAAMRWSDIRPFLEFEAEERTRARDFARAWDGDRLIFGQLRFVELISLLFVVIAAGGGWMVLNGNYPAEMKGAVITLVLISGFTGVKEFWLGSSRDSQRKTELMSEK